MKRIWAKRRTWTVNRAGVPFGHGHGGVTARWGVQQIEAIPPPKIRPKAGKMAAHSVRRSQPDKINFINTFRPPHKFYNHTQPRTFNVSRLLRLCARSQSKNGRERKGDYRPCCKTTAVSHESFEKRWIELFPFHFATPYLLVDILKLPIWSL